MTSPSAFLSHQHHIASSHLSSPTTLLFCSMSTYSPRASLSSFFTTHCCLQKIQPSRGGCPHADHVVLFSLHPLLCPFTDTCSSPPAAAFWARRGCAGVCLLSTKPCRTCSTTTGAARPDEVQQQRSLLVSFNERVISVDIGWSKCQYHSIILILQHLFHVALT